MDGYGGFYAKSNKPDRGRKTLYDITCMWNLKKYNMSSPNLLAY